MSSINAKLYCPISRSTCRGHECALAVSKSGYTTDIFVCGLSVNDQYRSQVIDTFYKKSDDEGD